LTNDVFFAIVLLMENISTPDIQTTPVPGEQPAIDLETDHRVVWEGVRKAQAAYYDSRNPEGTARQDLTQAEQALSAFAHAHGAPDKQPPHDFRP
jgi:hypothetical protein